MRDFVCERYSPPDFQSMRGMNTLHGCGLFALRFQQHETLANHPE